MTVTEQITEAELVELVVGIYRRALSDHDLDADSDFFEAGGDSLSAFRITAELEEMLGAEVPVALVFAYPSPADLATVIEVGRDD